MTTNLEVKQYKSVISQFWGQKSDTGLAGWDQIKMSAALQSFWKESVSCSSECWQNAVPRDHSTKAVVFLLALNRGHSQLLEAPLEFAWKPPPSLSKPATAGQSPRVSPLWCFFLAASCSDSCQKDYSLWESHVIRLSPLRSLRITSPS